jgi:hypothetical protein
MNRIEDLGVGDRVLVKSPVRPNRAGYVAHVTKARVILTDGTRWHRNSGRLVGSSNLPLADDDHIVSWPMKGTSK